jgi:hypothetical protein
MFPFEVLNSEASAANLLQQVRWRGALALFYFQSQLSISTIYFARAMIY